MKKVFVAGGAGFIGSNFIRHLMEQHPEAHVVNFDALTYAGNRQNLADVAADKRYAFVHGNVAYNHLQAVNETGYKLSAAYGLYFESLRHFSAGSFRRQARL